MTVMTYVNSDSKLCNIFDLKTPEKLSLLGELNDFQNPPEKIVPSARIFIFSRNIEVSQGVVILLIQYQK